MTQASVTIPANRNPVSPASQAGARSRDFHRLTVKRVEPLTDDSAAITLVVPDDLAGAFAFAAGQALTVRRGP
jgi:ring-1,2-phenylacetyl-CoA epoxidase subunit PaaE